MKTVAYIELDKEEIVKAIAKQYNVSVNDIVLSCRNEESAMNVPFAKIILEPNVRKLINDFGNDIAYLVYGEEMKR